MAPLRLLGLVSFLALTAACAPTLGPPGPPPPPGAGGPPSATVFRPADFSWSAVPGRNRIEGRLGYARGAQKFTCQGLAVILTPETLWTRRRMTILYNSPTFAALPAEEVRARTPSAPGEDYSAFVRRTTCTADDRFNFSGLPDGAWFVIALAKPVGGPGGNMAVMRRVETRNGRVVSVVL